MNKIVKQNQMQIVIIRFLDTITIFIKTTTATKNHYNIFTERKLTKNKLNLN